MEEASGFRVSSAIEVASLWPGRTARRVDCFAFVPEIVAAAGREHLAAWFIQWSATRFSFVEAWDLWRVVWCRKGVSAPVFVLFSIWRPRLLRRAAWRCSGGRRRRGNSGSGYGGVVRMVGSGNKKGDGLPAISSTNIFAALERRRSKSSSRRKLEREKSKGKDESAEAKQEEHAQFWSATQVSVKSWADCDDEDDYFATTAPPPDTDVAPLPEAKEALSQGEESEGDEEGEGDDEIEDEVEEDGENESGAAAGIDEAPSKLEAVLPPVFREPERQLSKKEIKKKELADLEAVLAEFKNIETEEKEENGSDSHPDDKKEEETGNGIEEGGSGGVPTLSNSKSSKRRKAKKEKSFKERDGDVPPTPDSELKDEETVEEVTEPVDPKEILKRMQSLKKKKAGDSDSSAAKAAAREAAARAAKLAAAKKKEKSHYNQQPVR